MTTTTDHKEIKQWAQKHKGEPQIMDAEGGADTPGLRLNFANIRDDMYLARAKPPRDVTWDEFFRLFDELELAFEYEDVQKIPDPSSAYRFIKREFVEEEDGGEEGML